MLIRDGGVIADGWHLGVDGGLDAKRTGAHAIARHE